MQSDLFGNPIAKPMMATKLKQPYAALMLHGKIETRTWDTSVRGEVLLSSSLRPFTLEGMMDYCDDEMLTYIDHVLCNDPAVKLLGQAYAVGELVHTRRMVKSDEAKCFIKFNPNVFCHIYENVRPIVPFLYIPSGIQKWRKVIEPETLSKIVYL